MTLPQGLDAAAGRRAVDNVPDDAVPPDYPRVRDLGGGVLQIDTGHLGNPGTIAVFALPLPSGGFALVESGPGSTRAAVSAGLHEAGLEPSDLRYVLLTHIHLDHAAAAGALLEGTDAKLVVHEAGAPHMIDPSRLMASALRVYGDALTKLWGVMVPVPAERVRAVAGGERLDVGGLSVRVIATPGHASHHVSYLLDDGTLFTGDSAGVRLGGTDLLRPALPPPDLDLEAWRGSVERMVAAAPERLVLTHFGQVDGRHAAAAHLRSVVERNREWSEAVLTGMNAGEDDAALVARVQRLEDAELAAAGVLPGIRLRYKITSDAAMTVSGLKRYFTRLHPERLTRA
jgi:glyoxylase-like metal-dependent hydrolase (beta-lactamase superfamily II)